jgi:hypothetical protein
MAAKLILLYLVLTTGVRWGFMKFLVAIPLATLIAAPVLAQSNAGDAAATGMAGITGSFGAPARLQCPAVLFAVHGLGLPEEINEYQGLRQGLRRDRIVVSSATDSFKEWIR